MKDQLAELIKRRHPLYEAMKCHWDFVEATYEGGRGWFDENIFRYLKEGDREYNDRVKRAYRFNHTKQVVDLLDKYLFKMPVSRKTEDAPDAVKRFWREATTSGLDIDAYAKRISNATSQFGRIWVCVDSTATDGGTVSVADEKAGLVKIYSYIIRPQDMLDMSYDESGRLRWCLVREVARDDEDPLNSTGELKNRFRLWTITNWILFEERRERGKVKVVAIDSGDHYLGEVPIFNADHNFSEELYASSGLIDDIAYLDRAVANYLSNLDAIIQDQSFSQLTMPAQGVMPGEDGYDKLIEAGTKRAFLYNGEAGNKPEYIAPDPKQAGVIVTVIGKIINEVYHSVGLAAARTKEDNGGGVDNSSGVAKAYDFEQVNALLAAKANALEITERRLAYLAALWAGQESQIAEDAELVTYPRDFDVKSLYDEFEIAARLSLLAAPDEVRREQMRSVVKKLFPAASDTLEEKLDKALTSWPPEDLLAQAGLPGAKQPNAGAPLKAASTQKTAKELTA
jgi:hypothetical protein